MNDSMQVHGSCHCGAIEFEAAVDPTRVTICHCTACQTLTGTAYRVTVPASAEGFRLIRGSPKTYIKVADSGNRRAQVFCADCGSHLYSHADIETPDRFGLRIGCLQERTALVPRKRIWCRSALTWSENLQGMEEVDTEQFVSSPMRSLIFAIGLVLTGPWGLHAQELPSGVALGMSVPELRHALPQLEKLQRPRRMSGGLVGAWHAPGVDMVGLSGEQVFFFAHDRLERVEFVGSAMDQADNRRAFDRIVEWGRTIYGQEIAADDAGARYAEWTAGDVQVYAQYGGDHASVRLVYKLRQDRDPSEL